MLAGTAGAVVEQHQGRAIGGAVGEKVGALGLAGAGIELGYRGFVGVQHRRLPQPGAQPIHQRLQPQADHTDPFGQRGARQFDAVAREDRLLQVQRQVIGVFLDRDLGQQAWGGEATVEEGRCDRFGHDRLPARQAYCGWTSRRTKNRIGSTSSFSLTCAPIFTSDCPQVAQSP